MRDVWRPEKSFEDLDMVKSVNGWTLNCLGDSGFWVEQKLNHKNDSADLGGGMPGRLVSLLAVGYLRACATKCTQAQRSRANDESVINTRPNRRCNATAAREDYHRCPNAG